MNKVFANGYQLNIVVADMEETNIQCLIKRLKRHNFNLSLYKVNRRTHRVFVFNYKENKVDSPALLCWIRDNGGISSYCL